MLTALYHVWIAVANWRQPLPPTAPLIAPRQPPVSPVYPTRSCLYKMKLKLRLWLEYVIALALKSPFAAGFT